MKTPQEFWAEVLRWISSGEAENESNMELPFQQEIVPVLRDGPDSMAESWVRDAVQSCPPSVDMESWLVGLVDATECDDDGFAQACFEPRWALLLAILEE